MSESIGEKNRVRNGRRWLAPLVVAGLVAMAAVAWYYYEQGSRFVSTSDANVTGDIVYIYPPASGTLSGWDVRLSDRVGAGTVLGTITAPAPASGSGAPPAGVPASIGVPITAPLAGVIIQNDAVVGQQVSPALGLPLAAEVNLGDLWVQANVPETSISRVHIGQRVDVTVDALPGRPFEGTVEAIQQATQSVFSLLPASAASSTFTKVTQRIPVRIRLDTTAGLAPGLDAEVRIHVG